jgi:hypothetical protein
MCSIRLPLAPAIIEDHGLLNPGDGLSDPRTPLVTSAKPPWCAAWRFRGIRGQRAVAADVIGPAEGISERGFHRRHPRCGPSELGTPGHISDYQGKPEIVLGEPSQLSQLVRGGRLIGAIPGGGIARSHRSPALQLHALVFDRPRAASPTSRQGPTGRDAFDKGRRLSQAREGLGCPSPQ